MERTLPNSFYGALRQVIDEGKGDFPAIIGENGEYTFARLVAAIGELDKYLEKMGIGKGDHVALWGFNSVNWYVAFQALIRRGAVAVLINYSLSEDEVVTLSQNTDVKYLIYGLNSLTKKDAGAAERVAGKLGISSDKVLDMDTVDLSGVAVPDSFGEFTDISEEESKNNVAYIIFTSGTTSAPKAVMLPQYGLVRDSIFYNEINPGISEEIACVAIPLFHIFALITTSNFLHNGRPIVLIGELNVDKIVNMSHTYKATRLVTVGTLHTRIVEHPDFKDKLSEQITGLSGGGAGLTQTQFLRIESAYKNASFINGYGQTEASGIIAIPRVTDSMDKRSKATGRIYPGKDVCIMDVNGNLLKRGEIGEVVIKDHGNLSKGYYGLPKEAQPFDDDGYLHTGDMGFIDDEDFLYLVGRIKDIIIRGGENISPLEVEKSLSALDNIREAKVLGAPHPVFGESVEACVTCFDPDKFDEKEVKKELKKTLSPFKIPSHIFVYDAFPLNPNNKIDQRSLKADMIRRLIEMNIKESLEHGEVILRCTLKNTAYNIVPFTAMIENIASAIGFDHKRTSEITLCVEEFLTERIINAYADVGDINIFVSFLPDYMRIGFSDKGFEYDIHKDDKTNLSARLILKYVDAFSTLYDEEKGRSYAMDFIYEKDFSISDFLMAHVREEK